MKFKGQLFLSLFTILLLSSFVYQAHAVQMTTVINPDANAAVAAFTGIRFITIKYPPGSNLANEFDGIKNAVSFSLDANSEGMQRIISAFNSELARTGVQISNATLDYSGTIRGDPDKLVLGYKVAFTPTLVNYVLREGPESVVALNWRDVSVNTSLVVNSPENQQIDINHPIGLLQATYPEFADQLMNTEIRSVMTEPLLNFHEMGLPMERWHFLFDPTGSQAGAAGAGFEEIGGARVVSIFSLGESSFREGTHSAQESFASDTIDGQTVSVQSSTPPPSGQIQIAGFAKIQRVSEGDLAIVTREPPPDAVAATGGFPIQVLLILGGMMGGVAVFVLIKARK